VLPQAVPQDEVPQAVVPQDEVPQELPQEVLDVFQIRYW
jgi:hypothetical protein